MNSFVELRNCRDVPKRTIPHLDQEGFFSLVSSLLSTGYRLCSFFTYQEENGSSILCAVCADDPNGSLLLAQGIVERSGYDSLTPNFPQAHLFEREIYEISGLLPQGHPHLAPVRFLSRDPRAEQPRRIGDYDFFQMQGIDCHEVAVGPVHAGIIEPGHFRFQCHGETVHHLEISLGYQHRGIERRMLGGPHRSTLHQIEAASGDSSIGHTLAYCQGIEALCTVRPSMRSSAIRAIALELERCANHTGDLGALAGDVGFLPTQAYCGRIRGDFLNLTALLCGNRFGRGIVIPGGCAYDIDDSLAETMVSRIDRIERDFLDATQLMWDTPSVMARFEGVGIVDKRTCLDLGIVGPPARAAGCVRDARLDHPYGYYRAAHIPVITSRTGDVHARSYIRWREVQESLKFIRSLLEHLPQGETKSSGWKPLAPEHLVVSLVEGWRGEICHTLITDSAGRFLAGKIVDPSFHNWTALELALREGQISDFPLCNKSFNLSYCGFDL